MRRARRSAILAVVGVLISAALGCSEPSVEPLQSAPPVTESAPATGSLVILADTSLGPAIDEVANRFRDAHPGAIVEVRKATAAEVSSQLEQAAASDAGIGADVVVLPAPERLVQLALSGRLASEPRVVAFTRYVVVVPAGNPAAVQSLADLTRPDLPVAICQPEEPCGALTAELAQSGDPRVLVGPDGGAVVGRVAAGEAAAGLAYETDVGFAVRSTSAALRDVEAITLPDGTTPWVRYSAAALASGPNPPLGKVFATFLLSEAAQAALADHGFVRVPSPR